ncbi:CPBP family intramembrane glutamic endopeptidase, partial [Spinactinospora alkalitolerans]
DLDARLHRILDRHPVPRELLSLIYCLIGFLVGATAVGHVFSVLEDDFVGLATPAVRAFFLLVLPVLLVDRAGLTVSRPEDGMPQLAMKVTRPWRWLGAVPVVACFAVLAAVHRDLLPSLSHVFVFGLVGALLLITVPEEVFFRGMIQSRLEWALGRWPGIVLASLLFAATYTALGGYVDMLRGGAQLLGGDVTLGIATYGVTGLLYGYLWSCYRSIWLNVILRTGVVLLVVGPYLAPPV